jgi:hypothetical protein
VSCCPEEGRRVLFSKCIAAPFAVCRRYVEMFRGVGMPENCTLKSCKRRNRQQLRCMSYRFSCSTEPGIWRCEVIYLRIAKLNLPKTSSRQSKLSQNIRPSLIHHKASGRIDHNLQREISNSIFIHEGIDTHKPHRQPHTPPAPPFSKHTDSPFP